MTTIHPTCQINTERFTLDYGRNAFYPTIVIPSLIAYQKHQRKQKKRSPDNKKEEEINPFWYRRVPPHAIAWYKDQNINTKNNTKNNNNDKKKMKMMMEEIDKKININIKLKIEPKPKLKPKPKCLIKPAESIFESYITIVPRNSIENIQNV